ncbi:MAG: hypothetical protein GOMPHAMPRED_000208 [Gomphillus americanus]|uniref:DUF7702 domain-containing protein n=1 Tax=Gomphillus americanus TaxID=1940652 RepID=A0A8H3EDP0_9LECA|nr:MAG: hypothetical protein GOMPHAMPRED_000208 [Gomphillus americanus]
MSAAQETMSFPQTSPSRSSLEWFDLVFFAILSQVTLFNLWRHGKQGILGWFMLANFCILKVVGGAMTKSAQNSSQISTYTTGAIITSATLSPLYFAMLGVWHEVAMTYKQNRPFLFGWSLQIIVHLVIASAIALVIVGAAQYNNPTNPTSSAHALEIAGVILFAMAWILFTFMVAALWRTKDLTAMEHRLLYAITICTPLLGLRTLYSILGACINNPSWNFTNGGTIAEKVVLQVLPEVLILIILNIGGVFPSSSETAFGTSSHRRGQGRLKRGSQARNIEMGL